MKQFAALILVSILISCNHSSEWTEIRSREDVYPKDTTMAFFKSLVLSDTQWVWVNAHYKNYPYKNFCKNKFQLSFDLTQSAINQNMTDSLKIARLTLNHFKQNGVTHFVGQTIFQNELNIYLYTENLSNPLKVALDFPIPHTVEFEEDENWKSYATLIEKKI